MQKWILWVIIERWEAFGPSNLRGCRQLIYTYTCYPSICVWVHVPAPDRVLKLHPRLGSEVIRSYDHFGSDHVNMQLWACTFARNLGLTQTCASQNITKCSDELGLGRPRLRSRKQFGVNINSVVFITSELRLGCSDRDLGCFVHIYICTLTLTHGSESDDFHDLIFHHHDQVEVHAREQLMRISMALWIR